MAEAYPTVFVLYALDTGSGDPSQALSSATIYSSAEAAKEWLEVERRDEIFQDGEGPEVAESLVDLVWGGVVRGEAAPVARLQGEYAYDEDTGVQYRLVQQQVS